VLLFTGVEIEAAYQPWPEGGVSVRRVKAMLRDPQVWRDLAYLLLLFPVGLLELVAVAFPAQIVIGSLIAPLTYSFIGGEWFPFISIAIESFWVAVLFVPIGIALFVPALKLMPVVANLHVRFAEHFLGPRKEIALEERIETLTESRSRVVDAVAEERRRIERDLHDGAQQRLVALAMDLGMAEGKFDKDPEAARALVRDAQAHAKLALSEMRQLVRGIHPSILTDRGLDAAVSALAARSPIPARVQIDLPQRLPETIESNAYFVIAEALTNIAKHSKATKAQIRVVREGSELIIEVADDGIGGAMLSAGSGLTGLRDRVAALDGRLRISSPVGGPTWIRAEIPCVS
jgi:signal transduction histidine kinase